MNDVNPYRAPDQGRNDEAEGGGGRRLRWLVAGVTAGVLVLSGAVAAAGWLLDGAGDRATEQAADVRWAEGITPKWMSEQMGLGIPATARSPQAAYQVTSRFDTGLLSFTLTRPEANSYLAEHPPEGKWLEPTSAQADVASHDFAHFGLPEPETFEDGMRYGDVCPGSAETAGESGGSDVSDAYGLSDKRCVSLYAHDYAPGRTRIYLRAHFEPGISPLPATPSPSASEN
ncbi:hypothetical protein ABTX99_08675 [Streptomyces flaveolus]|uniref:hypothetical protein n=1 Tax=Streptomyces flaveolus TaxID=67297 RepID=UPI0033165C5B